MLDLAMEHSKNEAGFPEARSPHQRLRAGSAFSRQKLAAVRVFHS
jgi:hypothetical protein